MTIDELKQRLDETEAQRNELAAMLVSVINNTKTKIKYEAEITEMARIACLCVPEQVCDQLGLSDDYYLEIREHLSKEERKIVAELNPE